MRAESFVNDLHQMQYAFALLYQIFPIHTYFDSDCLFGGNGSRRERQ
jgi:hypothetical protein